MVLALPARTWAKTNGTGMLVSFSNRFVVVLFCKGEENTGNDVLDVSETFVVQCQQGQTISVQAGTTNCFVESFSEARFVVFMLQAGP